MPDTKKEKLAAADEIVSFSIDAYVNDGITTDDDDPAVAESRARRSKRSWIWPVSRSRTARPSSARLPSLRLRATMTTVATKLRSTRTTTSRATANCRW